MDLTKVFIKDLKSQIKIPVAQDEYDGKEEKYCVYVYEDETPSLFGDNKTLQDTTYVRLTLYTPQNFDYFDLRKEITKFLEQRGFFISKRYTRLEDNISNQSKIRANVFELQIAGNHE